MKSAEYYFDFVNDLDEIRSVCDFDENGIPRFDYEQAAGLQYNPVTISEYALGNLTLFIRTNDDEHKNIFLKCADWLVENTEDYLNESAVWFYKFSVSQEKFPEYDLKSPWISAMAQGLVISVLTRAAEITGDKDYLNLSDRALRVFELDVSKGGVTRKFPDGGLLFEEYPTAAVNGVLNGFLFALLGVYDLSVFTGNETAKELWAGAITFLKNNLGIYDAGFWTKYDMRSDKRLGSKEYHDIHIKLVDILYNITNDSLFSETRDRWIRYGKNPVCLARYAISKAVNKAVYAGRKVNYGL